MVSGQDVDKLGVPLVYKIETRIELLAFATDLERVVSDHKTSKRRQNTCHFASSGN